MFVNPHTLFTSPTLLSVCHSPKCLSPHIYLTGFKLDIKAEISKVALPTEIKIPPSALKHKEVAFESQIWKIKSFRYVGAEKHCNIR